MIDGSPSEAQSDESALISDASSLETFGAEWSGNASIKYVRFNPASESRPFLDCSAPTEVVFPNDSRLRQIHGFHRCRALSRVEIPASVEEIWPMAFLECPALTEVIFAKDGRLRILDGFGRCASLSRVEIPASVDYIGCNAFEKCTGLSEVTFATDSRLRVLDGFGRCASLTRVEIPASVESIESSAFTKCRALTAVIFPEDSRLRSLDGFHGCISLNRLDIPASVEIIGSSPGERFVRWEFLGDLSGLELVFPSGTRMRPFPREGNIRAFIAFEDENDLKKRRRQVQAGTARSRR
jgi:hypothetical protein